MKKIFNIIICFFILFSIFSVPFVIKAETENNEEIEKTEENLTLSLEERIKELETLIAQLRAQLEEAKGKVNQLETKLQLTKQLRFGMRGVDVELLQEFLATDPDIYPEGLITGFFGRMTEKAVKKLQQKMGVEQVGQVGPKTFTRINELLESGAGSSGKVPPGLLRAPGIQKKIEQGLINLPETVNSNENGENGEDE